MSRSRVGLLVALFCLLGMSTAATAQDCVEDRSEEVRIAVAGDASVDPDCVIVKKGNAEVVWSGNPEEIKTVLVKFDRDASPDAPDDPVCSGATCTLNKAKQTLKNGEFTYVVWVENQDGSTAGKDPVLVIKP